MPPRITPPELVGSIRYPMRTTASWTLVLMLLLLGLVVPGWTQRPVAVLPPASTPAASLHAPAGLIGGAVLPDWSRLARATLHFPETAVHHWQITVPAVIGTGLLMGFADQPVAGSFHNPSAERASRNASNDLLLVAVPGEVLADSLVLRHGRSPGRTIEMAAAATIYTTALLVGLKHAAGRERPYTPDDGDGGFWEHGTSFPSGHTMTAFLIASLLAHRYRQYRWVAWLGYGIATATGILRVTAREHFPSDVAAGGLLGYTLGGCAVQCR